MYVWMKPGSYSSKTIIDLKRIFRLIIYCKRVVGCQSENTFLILYWPGIRGRPCRLDPRAKFIHLSITCCSIMYGQSSMGQAKDLRWLVSAGCEPSWRAETISEGILQSIYRIFLNINCCSILYIRSNYGSKRDFRLIFISNLWTF